MKKTLALLIAVAFTMPALAATEAAKPEQKKVCIKTTDAKTGKEVEKCKVTKIHQKHEGTKVEDAKKSTPAKK